MIFVAVTAEGVSKTNKSVVEVSVSFDWSVSDQRSWRCQMKQLSSFHSLFPSELKHSASALCLPFSLSLSVCKPVSLFCLAGCESGPQPPCVVPNFLWKCLLFLKQIKALDRWTQPELLSRWSELLKLLNFLKRQQLKESPEHHLFFKISTRIFPSSQVGNLTCFHVFSHFRAKHKQGWWKCDKSSGKTGCHTSFITTQAKLVVWHQKLEF